MHDRITMLEHFEPKINSMFGIFGNNSPYLLSGFYLTNKGKNIYKKTF